MSCDTKSEPLICACPPPPQKWGNINIWFYPEIDSALFLKLGHEVTEKVV